MKSIAVITGASSGMGREAAKQIARDTKHFKIDEVWLIARRRERLETLMSEIEKMREKDNKCPKPVVFEMDAAGKGGALSFRKCLEVCEKSDEGANGKLTIKILVNNAGFGTYGTFEESDVEKEMDMVELNCTAVTGITGYALPYMERGAVIINTASLAAFMPLGNFAVYGASKAFVLSFTVALAAEVRKKGIKVCALCPGPVSTEFALVASGGKRKEVKGGVSAEKVIQKCLKDARRGRVVSMMKMKWRITAFASRFFGRMMCARITYRFCPRPHNSL